MHRRFILLFLFLPFLLKAGTEDSLSRLISAIRHDTAGVRELIRLSDEISLTDGNAALILNRKAFDIAKETGDKPVQLESMLSLGVRLMNQGEYVEASNYLFPALGLADSMHNDAAKLRSLNSIGNLYAHQDQMDVAIGYYEEALKLARKTANKTREGIILNNLGNIYYMRSEKDPKNLQIAKKYYEEGYAIARQKNDTLRRITVMNNLILIYCDMEEYGQARSLADSTVNFCLLINDSADLAYSYSNIGRIYLQQNEYKKAIEYYGYCLTISQNLNNRDLIAEIYMNLGKAYAGTGDYETAYDYEVRYNMLYDSLINTSNTEIISDLKNKIQTERSESQINELKQQNEISDLRNSRQNLYLVLAIGGLILLIVLVFLLYNRSRVKDKANYMLNVQNAIIAQKNKDITDSINYAKRIQQTLLAHDEFLSKQLPEHFILFKPKDIVSGDFYWAAANGSKLFLAVCDCTGHGVPGAFMSLLSISFLNEAIIEKNILATNEIFNYSRKRLIASVSKDGGQDGMDGILLCFDRETNTIRYTASQNAPVIVRDGMLTELAFDKMPVGMSDLSDSFHEHTIDAQPGDMIYLFTDGYADQFGGSKGKKLKYRQLNEKLVEWSGLPVYVQQEKLSLFFEEWKGNHEQVDDVLLIGIRA